MENQLKRVVPSETLYAPCIYIPYIDGCVHAYHAHIPINTCDLVSQLTTCGASYIHTSNTYKRVTRTMSDNLSRGLHQ